MSASVSLPDGMMRSLVPSCGGNADVGQSVGQ